MKQYCLRAPVLISVAAFLLACVTGCSSTVGKYVNKNQASAYIELKSDGTFAAQSDPGKIVTGTYSQHGDDFTLVFPEITLTWHLSEGKLTCAQETFVKQ